MKMSGEEYNEGVSSAALIVGSLGSLFAELPWKMAVSEIVPAIGARPDESKEWFRSGVKSLDRRVKLGTGKPARSACL